MWGGMQAACAEWIDLAWRKWHSERESGECRMLKMMMPALAAALIAILGLLGVGYYKFGGEGATPTQEIVGP